VELQQIAKCISSSTDVLLVGAAVVCGAVG